MSKKKNIILIIISTILLILLLIILLLNNKNNLQEISYDNITKKINNKDSFVLCISRSNCSHCNEYKPKLKKIANQYDIIVYYIDIDKLNDNEQKEFNDYMAFDGSTPTTVFIKKGKESSSASRIVGDTTEKKILEKIKSNGFIKK